MKKRYMTFTAVDTLVFLLVVLVSFLVFALIVGCAWGFDFQLLLQKLAELKGGSK